MDEVRTTIGLPEPQWLALKSLAARRHCTISEVVSDALGALADKLDDPPQGLARHEDVQ
jgi:predicted DNA-binding ribbon-helix-helix protein